MKRKPRTFPRQIPQQARSRATVDAVVEAAAHLLATRGWHAATTNHIAERAGVSIGSLYKYFPSKPAIVAEVARRRIAAEVAAIEATLAAHPDDLKAMLSAMVETTADRYAASAALDTQLMEQLGPIEMARVLRGAEAEVVARTERYLVAQGRLRKPDAVPLTSFLVVHTLRGLLVAAAAHDPVLLGGASFRREIVLLLRRYLGCETVVDDDQ
jgi:AcrR family transcriptional regulator